MIFTALHLFAAIIMLIGGLVCLLINLLDPEWFRDQKQMSHEYGPKGMPRAYSGDIGRALYITIALLLVASSIMMLLSSMH